MPSIDLAHFGDGDERPSRAAISSDPYEVDTLEEGGRDNELGLSIVELSAMMGTGTGTGARGTGRMVSTSKGENLCGIKEI